jgi:hypothetical protein
MATWDEVLSHIEDALVSYEGAGGDPGIDFSLPANMPVLPAALAPRVAAIQERIATLAAEHEKALAAMRPSLAATSRPTSSRTGDLLNELA